jgi:hypothetical protein
MANSNVFCVIGSFVMESSENYVSFLGDIFLLLSIDYFFSLRFLLALVSSQLIHREMDSLKRSIKMVQEQNSQSIRTDT